MDTSRRIVKKAGRSCLRSADQEGHLLQAVPQSSWINSASSFGDDWSGDQHQQANNFQPPPNVTDRCPGAYPDSHESRTTHQNTPPAIDDVNWPLNGDSDFAPQLERTPLNNNDESSIASEHAAAESITDPGILDVKRAIKQYQSPRLVSWLLITLPIAATPIVLLTLICVYRVPTEPSVFSSPLPISRMYVLVGIEDTRLMFVASALNFITPLVAGYIMSLYAAKIVQKLKTGPHSTIYEFKFIGALCEASVWQLLKACYHGCKSSISVTTTLRFAMNTHLKLVALGLLTYAALATLHLTTRMENYDKVSIDTQYSPGRGLSSACLAYDRIINQFPCSYDLENADRPLQLREQFRLQRNTSKISRVEFVNEHIQQRELGIIIPQNVPSNIDFRALTFGLCTECDFITQECGMHFASKDIYDPMSYWTIFNCSTGFYGALGKNPVIENSLTANDSDIPLLGFKPSLRLQLGYYIDPGLKYVYNTAGYDAALNTTQPAIPDLELVNPAYLGVAGRIGFTGLGWDFPGNDDVFIDKHTYIDFAMRCKMMMFEVSYTRLNSTLIDISLSDTNGSIFEIFHGVQFYDVLTSTAWELQEILAQAGLQNSTSNIAKKWGNLFTIKVLSVIGSVSEARQALLQQSRTNLLVAKVPWLSVAFICFCTLLYVAIGVNSIRSRRQVDESTVIVADAISTPGAGFSAWLGVESMLQVLVSDHLLGPRNNPSRVTVGDDRETLKVELLAQ